MEYKILNFVDFTDMPLGRHKEFMIGSEVVRNETSAEEYRDMILIPALKNNERIILDLSNVYGFGISFLEELFSGLNDRLGISLIELNERLRIECTDDPGLTSIIEYILNNGTENSGARPPKSLYQRIKEALKNE